MMLLPSITRAPRPTRTRAWKALAVCTKRADARACIPSWLRTVTVRETIVDS